MFHAGLGNLLAEGYRATGWLLVGLLQIAVMLTLFAALERWRPVEPVTDRAAVRVDVIYTLIHRLGLVRVALFFSVDPLWDLADRQAAPVGPADLVAGRPVAGRHRHRAGQLPALPAAVRPGRLRAAPRAAPLGLVVAAARGAPQPAADDDVVRQPQPPARRPDPRHRVRRRGAGGGHRAVAVRRHGGADAAGGKPVARQRAAVVRAAGCGCWSGRSTTGCTTASAWGTNRPAPARLGGHNFAVLFPLWDLLFGTARFDGRYEPTGIRDQLPEPAAATTAAASGRSSGWA
jgi:hypothetical protein